MAGARVCCLAALGCDGSGSLRVRLQARRGDLRGAAGKGYAHLMFRAEKSTFLEIEK